MGNLRQEHKGAMAEAMAEAETKLREEHAAALADAERTHREEAKKAALALAAPSQSADVEAKLRKKVEAVSAQLASARADLASMRKDLNAKYAGAPRTTTIYQYHPTTAQPPPNHP